MNHEEEQDILTHPEHNTDSLYWNPAQPSLLLQYRFNGPRQAQPGPKKAMVSGICVAWVLLV
jgi:hypothetical protein